jgi:hypothetical protein
MLYSSLARPKYRDIDSTVCKTKERRGGKKRQRKKFKVQSTNNYIFIQYHTISIDKYGM